MATPAAVPVSGPAPVDALNQLNVAASLLPKLPGPLQTLMTPLLTSMRNLLTPLANQTIQERINRKLTNENLTYVNRYRSRILAYTHQLIKKFIAIRETYRLFIQYGEEMADTVLTGLKAKTIEEEVEECKLLADEGSAVQQILKDAGVTELEDFLIENKWALLLCGLGAALCAVPGLQFGLPLVVEATIAGVGATTAVVSAVIVAASATFDENGTFQTIQQKLAALQTELYEFRGKLHEFQKNKETSETSLPKLRLMAGEMHASCVAVIKDAEEIEKLAAAIPIFAKSDHGFCHIQ